MKNYKIIELSSVSHVFHDPDKVYIGVSNKDSELIATLERCIAFAKDKPSGVFTVNKSSENDCLSSPVVNITFPVLRDWSLLVQNFRFWKCLIRTG